jgi:hypothetical protein
MMDVYRIRVVLAVCAMLVPSMVHIDARVQVCAIYCVCILFIKYSNFIGGYTGVDCKKDIDECALLGNPCEHGGTCRNTPGSYL